MIEKKAFLLSLLGILLLAALGCSGGSTLSGSGGQVQIVLGGDPAGAAAVGGASLDATASGNGFAARDGGGDHGDACSRLAGAEVTFTSIVARNLEGQLVPLTLDYPVTVDLMALTEDNTVALPIGTLPPGTYDQLVVVMSTLTLTTRNGTVIAISPPPGGWTKIIRVEPFEVIEGETTTIYIRFHRGLSFMLFGEDFEFDPHFSEDDNGDDDSSD
jgi:hypothetical protein